MSEIICIKVIIISQKDRDKLMWILLISQSKLLNWTMETTDHLPKNSMNQGLCVDYPFEYVTTDHISFVNQFKDLWISLKLMYRNCSLFFSYFHGFANWKPYLFCFPLSPNLPFVSLLDGTKALLQCMQMLCWRNVEGIYA